MNEKKSTNRNRFIAVSLLVIVVASAWMGITYYFANRISSEVRVWLDSFDSLEDINVSEVKYRRGLFDSDYSFRIDLRGQIGDLYEKQMIAQGEPASPITLLVHGSIYHGPFLFQDRSFRFEQAFTEFQVHRPESHHGIFIDGKEKARGEITGRINGDYLGHLIAPAYDGPLTIGDDELRLSLRPSSLQFEYSNDLHRIESFLSIGDVSLLEEGAKSVTVREIEGSFSLAESSQQEITSSSVLTIEDLALTELRGDEGSVDLEGIEFQVELAAGVEGLTFLNVQSNISMFDTKDADLGDIGISASIGREYGSSLPWEGSLNIEIGRVVSDEFRAAELLASIEADVSESGVSFTALNSAESIYLKEVSNDIHQYIVQIGLGSFGNKEFTDFQNSVLELMRNPVTRHLDPYDLGVATRKEFLSSFTQESQNSVTLTVIADWKSEGREVRFDGEFPFNLSYLLESGDPLVIFYPNKGMRMDVQVSSEILDLLDSMGSDARSYLMSLDPQRIGESYRVLVEERDGEIFVGRNNITKEYVAFMTAVLNDF
jgi:hypothetical protein